jgi:hypothetical protein
MCDLALAKAARPLETLAWERAVEGTPEKVMRELVASNEEVRVGLVRALAAFGIRVREKAGGTSE